MSDLPRTPSRTVGKLLQSKLLPPRLSETVLPRSDLFARLDQGLSRPLILVTAPTGFGKTTLVASWLAARTFAWAWVTLDSHDNDPVRFWSYVVTALRALDPSLGKNTLAALHTARPLSLMAVLTPLINDLTRLSQPNVLVLEDYHSIRSSEVQSSVAFFIQNLPPELHLVLISRFEPELPLAILRARGSLAELDAANLRFRPDETGAFLQSVVQSQLPPEVIAQLQERTEGWAAGLRLAVQSLQNQGDHLDVDLLERALAGSHRHVSDYLIQEVFASQPEFIQSFLLQTCFLSRLSGPLCDAVMQSAGGGTILEQLEREELFIVPLRDPGPQVWYRYHAMFAESIQALARRRLDEIDVQAIYERASAWFEAQGLIEDAIETALSAGLFERALGLIENYLEHHNLSEIYTLSRWLEQVPARQICLHPMVSFTYAQVILYTFDRFSPSTLLHLEPFLKAAESAWQTDQDLGRLGMLHAFRGQVAFWQGDFQKAYEYARQSLEEIPEQDVLYRGISQLTVSDEALNDGRIAAAQDHALEARALLGASQNIHGVLAAIQILSEVFYWQGQLDQAEHLCRQILAEAVEINWGEAMLDDQGFACLGLARIAYERNDLAQAEAFARRALDLARRRGNELLQIQAGLVLSNVQSASGSLDRARDLVDSLSAGLHNPVWLHQIQVAQASLAVRSNEAASLEPWVVRLSEDHPTLPTLLKERRAFLMARLQLASGDGKAALMALNEWQADAARQGRVRSQVEALTLEALAHQVNQDQALAARALSQALRLGQARGFRRLFLDEGPRLAVLLRTAGPMLPNRAISLFASALLQAFSPDRAAHRESVGIDSLIDPLSQQELRVLRLLAGGLSNSEIARELVVSRNTIKTQVQSIYRKLNVNSRTEAGLVAQELHLL